MYYITYYDFINIFIYLYILILNIYLNEYFLNG